MSLITCPSRQRSRIHNRRGLTPQPSWMSRWSFCQPTHAPSTVLSDSSYNPRGAAVSRVLLFSSHRICHEHSCIRNIQTKLFLISPRSFRSVLYPSLPRGRLPARLITYTISELSSCRALSSRDPDLPLLALFSRLVPGKSPLCYPT